VLVSRRTDLSLVLRHIGGCFEDFSGGCGGLACSWECVSDGQQDSVGGICAEFERSSILQELFVKTYDSDTPQRECCGGV